MEKKEKIRDNQESTSGKEINIQWFFVSILIHWKLFLISIVFFLACGFMYLRYSIPIYNVSSEMVLKDKKGGLGNSKLSIFEGMSLINPSNNIDNEIEILQSRDLLEEVVRELELYVSYQIKGRFKDTELYGNRNRRFYYSAPVKVYMDDVNASKIGGVLMLHISRESDNSISVVGNYGEESFSEIYHSLPGVLQTPFGEVHLEADSASVLKEEHPMEVTITNPLYVAMKYASLLTVQPTSKSTSIVKMSLKETHRERGVNFLYKLVDVYNRDVMNDKNRAASNAARFIEDRLKYINSDLSFSETDIEEYRKQHRVTNINMESEILLQDDTESNRQLTQVGTQMELLNFLNDEFLKTETTLGLLPPAVGLSDNNLSGLINLYNSIVLERDRLMTYTNENNPRIIRMNEKIYSLREDISTGIKGSRKALQTRNRDLQRQSNKNDASLGEIPRRERELTEKRRQQEIKENLYIMLLEKKEEAALSLAVTAPSAKIIESPLAGAAPIAPNRMYVYTLCLLLGGVLPYLFLGMLEIMNFKIQSEEDIQRRTDVPVIVSLPQDKKKSKTIVVEANSTAPIVEMFRLLRANISSILEEPDKKIILVTSFLSGEGKTFVSINLAMTFALKYKTLLVGLDIRRPKLASNMGLKGRAGLVSYLNGDVDDIDSVIYHEVEHKNLDVLAAGVVPPNPNELLMESRLDELFEGLREKYDYIILDTSPVGSVSDTFLLDRIADASLFVVREGFTPKHVTNFIDNVHREQRLKKLKVIYNCAGQNKKGKYGYGYGYGYGNGYGYGYGHGYSSKEETI